MLDSVRLKAAYETFRNKWNTLPDKDCEELFYTKLGIPIPEDLHPTPLEPWEELKKEFSHQYLNEEELKLLRFRAHKFPRLFKYVFSKS
tara:strand:+ start:64 stop:330 length:267 start_codon:yes stop_codon:yes gene_type:complete